MRKRRYLALVIGVKMTSQLYRSSDCLLMLGIAKSIEMKIELMQGILEDMWIGAALMMSCPKRRERKNWRSGTSVSEKEDEEMEAIDFYMGRRRYVKMRVNNISIHPFQKKPR
jgi:hypothetical protein